MYLNVENGRFLYNCNCTCIPLSILEALLQLYSRWILKGSAKNSKVHVCLQNFSDFCWYFYLKNFQKSLSFCQLQWTFEFLPEPSKIPREYNCSKVSEKAWEIQILTFISVTQKYHKNNSGFMDRISRISALHSTASLIHLYLETIKKEPEVWIKVHIT